MTPKTSPSSATSARKDILMPTPKKPAKKRDSAPAKTHAPGALASSKRADVPAPDKRGARAKGKAPPPALPARQRTPIGSVAKADAKALLPRTKLVAVKSVAAGRNDAKHGAASKSAAKASANAPRKPRALSIGGAGSKARQAATPPPPPVEEVITTEELWVAYRKEVTRSKGADSRALQELRNHLMERHVPLVRYIAERLLQTLPKSIELDDLISAGMFGLMDAIRGFDQSRGIKFKTYCSTRIRGAILDQLRSQDWVPRLVRLKATRIERAYQKLQGEFGREPTHAELAQELAMGHDELQGEIEEARPKSMYSLSEKWEDGEDDSSLEKVEVLVDRTAIDPVHELNRRDLMLFLTKSLSDKERFIISMYYEKGLTMREIGELLALTESRVCQIHSNVMNRLKDHLEKREEGLIP
jgi:RNA polymerase sigma factor for flagellar operon FliA